MKTIIFLNNKGGVGKTASVTTIVGNMLATEFKKKVLLIDLDPQMNATCMYSDIDFVKLFSECIKTKTCMEMIINRLKTFYLIAIWISMSVLEKPSMKIWILSKVI